MSYCEVPPVRRLVSVGFNIIDSIVKLFELVPPSIVAPVPATIDNVGLNPYPLIVDQLSGGILTNLNPLIVVVDVTINLRVLLILVLIKSPVVAWRTPSTIYALKLEYNRVPISEVVGVIVGVNVRDGVYDGVSEGVGVYVRVCVGVRVTDGVIVGVSVSDLVGLGDTGVLVKLGVRLGVLVGVGVLDSVRDGVGVCDSGVLNGTSVGVTDGVSLMV